MRRLDITGEVCPMTYVRVKLALEELAPGDRLVVRLKGDEPRRNVPRSAAEEGHTVVSLVEEGGGVATLTLEVGVGDGAH